MKVRSGFVSNSSSSSFICNVCGIMESGMDASAKDFDMSNCQNGHTFCNNHFVGKELSWEDKKSLLLNDISNKILSSYYTPERKQIDIDLICHLDEDGINVYFEEHFYECDPSRCPICTFQKIDCSDGFMFLKKKFSLTDEEVLQIIKSQFINYTEFKEFLKPQNV
jgi:hypothetical protein